MSKWIRVCRSMIIFQKRKVAFSIRPVRSRIKRIYTIKYTAIHCCYWSICCSSGAFVAVYLLSLHYTNSQIGLALAAVNLLSAFLQPVVAAVADRSRKLFLKNFFTVLLGVACFFAAARFFLVGAPPFLLALLLVLELVTLYSLQPLVISLGIRINDLGVPVNFGFARGTGSLAYAGMSVFLGFLVDTLGPNPLSAVSVFLYLALGALVFTFAKERNRSFQDIPTEPDPVSPKPSHRTPAKRPDSSGKRKFWTLMAAVAVLFCSYSIIGNYLIQITEHVGGSAREMGIAAGLSASIEMPSMIFFGFLVKKFRCSTILKCSLFFFFVKSLLTLTAANIASLYVAQFFQAFAYAQFTPASVYYVRQVVGERDTVKGQAFMTGAATLGSVAASLVGGWLLDGPGVTTMLAVGTTVALVGFVMGFFSIEKTRTIADA